MACCFEYECPEYSVTPVLVPPCYPKCKSPAVCFPCLPRCPKPEVVYYCPKPIQRKDCCHNDSGPCCDQHQTEPACCKPVRTKYVMPCYKYEDGRIERYVPTVHGRLPPSAYCRNGMQDQIHGYRGARRYLCSCDTPYGPYVHTIVEPIQRLYPKVTQEMYPVKRKKDKK